jgi:hypothetical protein
MKRGILLLFLLLSSCRVGNRVETVTEGVDTTSGYYRTSPESYTLSAILDGNIERQASQGTNLIPSSQRALFSDPMALVIQDAAVGKGTVLSSSGDLGFQVSLDLTARTFSASAQGEGDLTDICRYRIRITRTGGFTPGPIATFQGLQTRGRLAVASLTTHTFVGTGCPSALLDWQACYLDAGVCEGDTSQEKLESSAWIHNLLDPYVDAGILSTQEIGNVQGLASSLQYR